MKFQRSHTRPNQTRRRLLLFSLCFFAWGATSLVMPGEAAACSCAPPPTPAEALESADAVFFGEVSSMEETEWTHQVQFDVTRSWKGADADNLAVTTPESAMACGFEFQRGESYLVFAYEHEDTLEVTSCGRTRLADESDAISELPVDDVSDVASELSPEPTADGDAREITYTITVDPLTTALGFAHVQIERKTSERWTFYAGPHMRLFDSVFDDEPEPFRGYGAEFGVRHFLNSDAPEGVWVGARAVGARLMTHGPAEAATTWGGYVSALAGYTWLPRPWLVLSGGAGVQYLHYEIDDLGVRRPFVALHTALGFAF